MNEFVRTPESYFSNLTDFPYHLKYLYNLTTTSNARLAYIDQGIEKNGVALFLHGNPTWSYCYRKMIPIMLDAGYRVVAPDMIGFGRSDKPIDQSWHNFMRHYQILLDFITALSLKNITLICHDWGGLFGLNIVPVIPEKFQNIIILNTMLCTGTTMPEIWHRWVKFNNQQRNLDPVQCLVDSGCSLSDKEKAGFRAPYPHALYKAAFRQFPRFIPDTIDAPGAELGRMSEKFWSNDWQGKSFVAIGAKDQILSEPTKKIAGLIRNCPEPLMINDAGHFLFEWGDRILENALLHIN